MKTLLSPFHTVHSGSHAVFFNIDARWRFKSQRNILLVISEN